MKKIYFILLAVLAIASCKKPEPETPELPATGNVTLIATAPSAWTAGQTIGLAGASINKVSSALEAGDIAQDGKASFLFSDIAKGQYVAYYPYNSANKAGVTFTVAASQDGSEPVVPLLSAKGSGFGAVEVVDFDSPVNVELKPVGAVLNVFVYGGAADEVMTAFTVKAVGEQKLSGSVTCSNKGAVSVTGAQTVAASGLQYSVSASAAPQDGINLLVLPVEIAASEAGTVTYTVTTADANYVFNSKAACTWTAGSKTDIVLDINNADAVTLNCTVNATAPSAWTAGQTLGLAGATAVTESSALAADGISDEGKKGAFLFSGVDAGSYLAFWPYSAGNSDGTVSFSVASLQNGSFTMPLMSASNGSYAPVSVAGGNTSVNAEMKAVGAVLNFKLYGGPSGETITSISVKAEGSETLVGTVTYGSDAVLKNTANASSTVSVSASQSASLDAAPSDGVKALVLPVSIAASETGTVTYTITTGKGNYIFKSKEAAEWTAGTENDIVLNLGEADETPYSPYDWRDFVNVSGVHIPAYSSFLPAAPTTGDSRLEIDAKYAAAAENETAERKAVAAGDMKLSVAGIFATFSKINGIDLSTDSDADLADLMKIVISSCIAACPDNYPSSIAATGWASALLLAQLHYQQQEDILKAGIRIGESAVIAGRTTYSAAHTGQIVASMLMSSLRSNAAFAEKLAGITASRSTGYPADKNAFANFLPEPPSNEITNLYDKDRYLWGVSQRDGDRGTQAVKDNEYSDSYMMEKYYSTVSNYRFTQTNSPDFYALIHEVFGDKAATLAKEQHNRTRPYDFFEGGSNIVEMPANAGQSYPSGHTTAGFLTGLVYSEIDPAKADEFYLKAYNYGISRVIVGVHYQSDIDAGILTAAAALSRYHASEAFVTALAKAKKNYAIAMSYKQDNNNPNINIGYGDNDEEFK